MMDCAIKARSFLRSRACAIKVCMALSLSLVWDPLRALGLERFHFDYAVYGVGQPQNLQIFDDGLCTFLMWDGGFDAPRVQEGVSKDALMLKREGAYWVLQGVHSHLVLRFGQGYFHVLETGRQDLNPSSLAQVQLDLKAHSPHPLGAMAGFAPQQNREALLPRAARAFSVGEEANSYAQPIRGDELSWRKVQDQSDIEVSKHHDQGTGDKHQEDRESMITVPFSKGSKLLGNQAKQKVREFLRVNHGEFDLTVVGYEDDSYLENLGRERSQAIFQYLLSLGVREAQVKLQMEPFTELRAMSSNAQPIAAKIIWRRTPDQSPKFEGKASGANLSNLSKDQKASVEQPQLPLHQEQSGAFNSAELGAGASETLSVIKQGELIHDGLARFAKSRQWTLMWHLNRDWKAVAEVDLSKPADAVEAVSKVIEALRQEGHALELRVYDDNRVMEVVMGEVFND